MGPGGHRGERVGEAKCPGPHDMLNQIPIWTKDGQRGVLTTKWFKKHWRTQMSIGARHTACHQFSQVIALQRWILRHENELSAPTLEDIRTRLAEAADEASTHSCSRTSPASSSQRGERVISCPNSDSCARVSSRKCGHTGA
eukprot:3924118-Amphidinium_carterae.1